ncbi:protein immune deficiency [Sabethes cyaneus]|uniref:protein immune deficiency n=1 Tax=Sabethes cyaneus TaxID=53552 RepID=UPI00221E2F8D|nr:protein immune deficiency [Sabethes cyaneus]
MAKFVNLFTNLFPKTNSKLESDAAIIPRQDGKNSESRKLEASNSDSQIIQSTDVSNSSATQNALLSNSAPGEHLTIVDSPLNLEHPNVTNNVHNNILSAPQTSINSTTGIHVYQIKNASNVHIGNSITIHSASAMDNHTKTLVTNGNKKWSNLKLSETIRQMMECNDDLDTEMMDTISRHLGYEWKSFARTLNYSAGQIESFECDHKTLSEQIFHFVLDWSRNDDEPSLGKMGNLLWEQNHKETVYYMKILWKNRKQNAAV